MSDGVALTTYRVVQEALSNVRRHAGPAPASGSGSVGLDAAAAGGPVVVEDDGRGAASHTDGRGLGLVGMRERVALHGGEVAAGPDPGRRVPGDREDPQWLRSSTTRRTANPSGCSWSTTRRMVRAGFRMLVDSQPDLRVVGEAGDGLAALQQLAVTRADVVLMDVRMPRLDGVETTRRLGARPAAPG